MRLAHPDHRPARAAQPSGRKNQLLNPHAKHGVIVVVDAWLEGTRDRVRVFYMACDDRRVGRGGPRGSRSCRTLDQPNQHDRHPGHRRHGGGVGNR